MTTVQFVAADLWAFALVWMSRARRVPARVLYPVLTVWLAAGIVAARLTGAV